ncbi:hypothetical protein BLA29_002628, partial [Euroglyphus maynei]
MEFFDSTGISNEEAQALDVIKHESSGVEFLLNYNIIHHQLQSNNNNNYINSQNEHSKLSNTSYLVNGNVRSPPTLQPPLSSSQNSILSTPIIATSNQTNHYYHHHQQQPQHSHQNNHSFENSHHHHQHHHHHNNNNYHHHQQQQLRFINHQQQHHHQNHNNEWETTPTRTVVTTSASNHHEQQSSPPNSTVLVTNLAQSAGAHGHPPHPYIFGAAHPAYYPPPPPPNHPYAIHALPLGASQPVHPTAAAASVNQHPRMQNIVHSSSNKNSKNPNVNNSPICDIRNSSNIYMSSQYSDATRQMIDATQHQRLKNASVSGDQSGGNISDQTLISNGGSTATVAMQAHHLSPYANPYAFQHHALTFPHHFTQPFYYVTPESFLQYSSIQPPQTHISPIPPPAAHLISTSSSINLPLTSSNQPPQLLASSSIPSAAIITTLSSSSMSASSVSSTSTTPYQNNNSGQEVLEAQTTSVPSSDNQEQQSPNDNLQLQKNRPMSISDDKNSMIEQNVPSPQSTNQNDDTETNQNASENSSPETNDVKQASDYLKHCLNISDSSTKNDDLDTTNADDSDQMATPTVINNNEPIANTELESITDVASEQFADKKQSDPSSNKPTTWASKLFPTNITSGLNNMENQIPNANNKEESK